MVRGREVALVDAEGVEWVRANLSPTRLNRIVKEFAKFGVMLTERELVSA